MGQIDKCVNTTLPFWQLWAKPLSHPDRALQAALLINLSPRTLHMPFPFAALDHEESQVEIVDVWSGSQRRVDASVPITLEPHDSRFVMVYSRLPEPPRTLFF